jgi:hypothetical protein
MKKHHVPQSKSIRFGLLGILFLIPMISGCSDKSMIPGSVVKEKISLSTEYQAVFLDNGQAFFGKLENADSEYPLLKDVFYIQRLVNKDTNEVKNTLIKRGSEWHAPDQMYINAKHIVLIEPVNPKSKVAELITEAKTQKAGAAQ